MTAAVIVAGGRGARLGGGGLPKGLRPLCGRPLFAWSVRAALGCPLIDSVLVVAPPEHVRALVDEHAGHAARLGFVAGGSTRQKSVLCGLAALALQVEWVAVHDAARPLVTPELFAAVIGAARASGGAFAAHRATDTIRRIDSGRAVTLPRSELWHAETPQVFRRHELQQALTRRESEGIEVTDEAEAMELEGHALVPYANSEFNPKISTEADWRVVEHLLLDRLRA